MKKKKNDEKVEEVVITQPQEIIGGAFIAAQRVVQNTVKDTFLIKLSSINTITPLFEGDKVRDECLFYTYKDCCYYVPISAKELRKAINSFIFEQDSHWEIYG